jgi:hypothetical protein
MTDKNSIQVIGWHDRNTLVNIRLRDREPEKDFFCVWILHIGMRRPFRLQKTLRINLFILILFIAKTRDPPTQRLQGE